MEMFVIITVQFPGTVATAGGTVTLPMTLTVQPGADRMGLYEHVRDRIAHHDPRLRDGIVLFYSAEPMQVEFRELVREPAGHTGG